MSLDSTNSKSIEGSLWSKPEATEVAKISVPSGEAQDQRGFVNWVERIWSWARVQEQMGFNASVCIHNTHGKDPTKKD